MKKRIIAIASVLLGLSMLLTSCVGGLFGGKEETVEDTSSETANDSADSGYLTLYADKTAYFDVIKEKELYEDYMRTKLTGDFFESVLMSIGEKFGSPTAPGFTENVGEKGDRVEIHYGMTDCEEARRLLDEVALDAHGYCVSGNKIFIYGHTLAELSKAGSEFVIFMRKNSVRDENNNKVFKIPADTNVVLNNTSLAILEAPKPEFGESSIFCDDGDDGRMWVVSGCTAADYSAYRNAVSQASFELYDENEIDGNLFATYKKGDIILDTWYTKDGYVRVTATRGFDLMPKKDESFEGKTEPGVAMVGGVTDEAARSQLMFFKLSDGRFVVVDGGIKTGGTMDKLYGAMRERAENPEHIVIACWLFTHTHGDHIGAIQELAANPAVYKDKLTIESFMHNFSDNEQAMVPAQEVGSNDELRGYFKKFPDAKIYKVHPGNKAYFADMEIEVLSTFENYIYKAFPNNWNAVNSMYKITLGGQDILIPGDTSNYDQETLVDIYSDALKCDILQAVHHGFRGGTVAMYRSCLPKVVLFCCCNDGEYGIDNYIKMDYNQALVDKTQNPNFEEYFVAGTSVTYLPLPYVKGSVEITH